MIALVHLIPLPPEIWQSLGGRQELVDVDKLVGLTGVWRPLTLTPMNGWHALLSLFVPLAIILLGIQLDREDIFRLLPLVIALGGLSGILGLLQAIGDPQGPLYFYRITNNGSAVGLFANRNHAATLLACMFPMLAVYVSTMRENKKMLRVRQYIVAVIIVIIVPTILVTGSRSGLVVAVIGLVAGATLYRQVSDESHCKNRRFPNIPIIETILVFVLVSLTYFLSRAEAIERFAIAEIGQDDRTDFWEVSIDLFWKYFPWGSGSGSFAEVYKILEPTSLLNPYYLNRAHNDWIEIAVTFGIIGVATLTAAVVIFVIRSYELWHIEDGSMHVVAYGRLATVLVTIIAIASISDYPLRTPTLMGFFTICLLWIEEWKIKRSDVAFSGDKAPQRLER